MDLYPAPLSITKKASMSAVQPLLTFGIRSSTKSSARTSSSDSTVLASNKSLHDEWQNLDIPRIRPSNAKKGTRRRGLTMPIYSATNTAESRVEGQSLSSSPCPVEGHLQNQQTGDKEDSHLQAHRRISQFFHSLDKKLMRHSTRGVSRRLSSNIRSIRPEMEDYSHNLHSPWKYNFAPPISVVDMEMREDGPLNNFRRAETSVHITIKTDVNMESAQSIQYSLDIDAMILLNMT
jgi:hypothetical protein